MAPKDDVLISIIIPVKNGDFWLKTTLTAITRQTLFVKSEIIIIDSGSTDNTLEILKQFPVRLIEISPTEFNHGETRNLGVREARGKYIVMTVQDACPASDLWLQYFIDGFVNEKVVALCGLQVVPHDLDKNPVVWFRNYDPPQKSFLHYSRPEKFLELSPLEQRQKIGWDNVTSAYLREILIRYPFPKIDFGEDMFWSREMLLKGFTLGKINEAMVFHYHHYTPKIILSRTFSEYYFEYNIFKLRPVIARSVYRDTLNTIKILLKESAVSWPGKLKWLFYNINYFIELQKSINLFNNSLNKGESFLDAQYQRICKKAPQALKY